MKAIGRALAVFASLLNGGISEQDLLFSTSRSLSAKANQKTLTLA